MNVLTLYKNIKLDTVTRYYWHYYSIKQADMVLFIIHLYFGLHWFFTAAWAFSSWRWVVTTLIVHRLLIAVSSLVVENRLSEAMWASTAVLQHGISSGSVQALVCKGSVVAACRLGCSTACRVFPDQRGNPCPLHWQNSPPLYHQGNLCWHHFWN